MPYEHPFDARALGEQQLAVLTRLAEIGVGLAEGLQPCGAEGPDVGLAFSRIARAVRLTLALQGRVAKEIIALEASAAETGAARAAAAASALAQAEEARIDGHKDRIGRVVRQAIRAERRGEVTIERLMDEAYERLDEEDALDEILQRPIGETVARICRTLGLSPDWSRWAEEPWARREAGQAGSPFAIADPYPVARPPDAPPDPAQPEATDPPELPPRRH